MKSKRFRLTVISILVISVILVSEKVFLDSKYVVPILMYHSIDEKAAETKLSVLPENFDRQMRFLNDRNYNVVTLKELVDIIRSKKKFPPKTVAITFDDGYENNYLEAFPVIKKYGIPITIFMVINNIGKKGYLSLDQIKEMTASGLVAVDSHTLTHSYLPKIKDKDKLADEIYISKIEIEDMTGRRNLFFSYPLGGFNKEIRYMVKAAGYYGACATNPGGKYPRNDIYALKRIRISRTSDSMFVFWIEASGYYTFIKEIRDEE